MHYTHRLLEESEGIQLFRDATNERKLKQNVRRNKEKAMKRALLTL